VIAVVEFALPDSVGAILRPPEEILVTEWVERHRVLSDRDVAQPGPFRYDYTPYWIEPTNALTDPTVGTVTILGPSRCGKSEVLKNVLAYSIDRRPLPAIYVLEREKDIKEEFSGAIRRMIECSPKLASHIRGSNWASDESLVLDTMTVLAGQATTPSDFLRRTSGLNLFDEVDNCEAQAKSERLGSIWTLLLERITTFEHRGKQYGVTTPTLNDGAAWVAYEQSDRRRYWCPCPYCGTYQVLRFENIVLIPGHEEERNPDIVENKNLARYRCEHPDCGGLIANPDKYWMTQRGIWVPACQVIAGRLNVDDPSEVAQSHFRIPLADRFVPKLSGKPPITRNRGYWTDVAISPWRTFSQFLAKFFKTKDNRKDFRVFHNTWRALPWKETTQSADWSELRKKLVGSHSPSLIPCRAVQLLAYADVQDNWLWYGIAAFGPGEECWIVQYGQAESFAEVEKLCLDTPFAYEDNPDLKLTCDLLGFDSGGHRTYESYDRWRMRPDRILLTKGDDQHTGGEKWRMSLLERRLNGERMPTGIKLFRINTGIYKEKLFALYARLGDGAGALHFHRETSDDFLKQATAEEYVRLNNKKRSKPTYGWRLKSDGMPNHMLDVLVGLYFMADRANSRLLPTRDVMLANASRPMTLSGPSGAGGIRKPDGRPWIPGRR